MGVKMKNKMMTKKERELFACIHIMGISTLCSIIYLVVILISKTTNVSPLFALLPFLEGIVVISFFKFILFIVRRKKITCYKILVS